MSLLATFALSFEANANAPAIYTVAKVSVAAEADNAVAAKEKALAKAQQIALRNLLKRMTGWSAHSKLPILPDDMVERMVEGFAVRQESNSNTRYLATLDFSFEPNAVRDILNRFGFPYIEQQAAQALLVPVMMEGGAVRQGSDHSWYQAFSALDTEHAMTPIKLVPPAANLSASMVNDLSVNSRSVFDTLSYQYRSENLILAIADIDPQATQLRLQLIGRDTVGSFALKRAFRIYDRDIDGAAKIAAEISLKIIEGRWKVTQLAGQGVVEGQADLQTLSLTAQFSGLKSWQSIRARLQRVPGVQGLDIKSLNARGASLTIDFPGGSERFAQAARSQGLALEQRGGALVLIAR